MGELRAATGKRLKKTADLKKLFVDATEKLSEIQVGLRDKFSDAVTKLEESNNQLSNLYTQGILHGYDQGQLGC